MRAYWLAWTTLTLVWVTLVTDAVPATNDAGPCRLEDDPTLGDLVLFRLCIEAEEEESQLKDLLQSPEAHAQLDDSEWPEPPSDDVPENSKFPYCYALTPAQCRMLLVTLDDILRLSETGDENDVDENEAGRMKRSTKDRLRNQYLAQLRKERKNKRYRLEKSQDQKLQKFLKNSSQRSGYINLGGRFGRSAETTNPGQQTNQINEHEEVNSRQKRSADVTMDGNTSYDDVEHRRSKRAVLSRINGRNTRALLAAYKAWRSKNGYGKSLNRWG